MGEEDRKGHELGRFIRGVAEHQALVARPDLAVDEVDSEGDVVGLAAEIRPDLAGPRVEAAAGVGVSDFPGRVADDPVHVEPGFGRHLAGHNGHVLGEERFAGDFPQGVLGQDRVEDGVGDLVGHLVGMAFGHRFRSEDEIFGHQETPFQAPGLRLFQGGRMRAC